MATIAALIGANIISGIGSSIAGGLGEQRRRSEWQDMHDFNLDRFNFQKDFQNRQLNQQNELLSRGQNLNFAGNMMQTGMQTGTSLIGNLLSYNHAQDSLNFQKELNSQRRSDLENEGLPLSYLHIGGAAQRSVGAIPPMRQTQIFGRNLSNPWGFANSGTNLRETYGPRPPTYDQSQARTPGNIDYISHANPAL